MRMKMKLTYANIVATVALGLVLAGGTAFAAQKLVTSSSQVARGVITNGKVKPGTLQADRLSADALAALDGPGGQRATVQCQPGESAAGGGVSLEEGNDARVNYSISKPVNSAGGSAEGARAAGGQVWAESNPAFPDDVHEFRVWAICVSV